MRRRSRCQKTLKRPNAFPSVQVLMRVVFILLASAIVCWGNDFFASGRIPHIKIDIAKTNMDSLRRDARKYVPATFRDGDTVYTNIAIRLKGAAGSFRPVDDRPA